MFGLMLQSFAFSLIAEITSLFHPIIELTTERGDGRRVFGFVGEID